MRILDPASRKVDDFLRTMERRDLEAAKSFLAPGFTMTFPGGARMTSLEELIEWSKTRYRRVEKTYQRFDEIADGDETVVYCFGTLSGEWLDGSVFSGIRFIDRFKVKHGLFTEQRVWNDMGEARSRC